MTPKEKAKELISKFKHLQLLSLKDINREKECTLIALDILITSHLGLANKELLSYWQEVKEEINKL